MTGRPILTNEQARQVLTRYQRGESQTRLARELGVAKSTISMIVNGQRRQKAWPQ